MLKKLDSTHAMIVHGDDGLDEITTTTCTKISHLKKNGDIITESFSPLDYGFQPATLKDLKGGLPKENARIIREILEGVDKGKKADIVVLNAAFGIFIGNKVNSISEGITVSREMVKSGAALAVLDKLATIK